MQVTKIAGATAVAVPHLVRPKIRVEGGVQDPIR